MKSLKSAFWLIAVSLGGILFSPREMEAQSHGLSPEELTHRSSVVAVGKVTSLHAQWTNDRSRIVTQVTVAVDQFFKGASQNRTLVITVPGGEVDGVGELYSHAARFHTNEEVIVFAERDAGGNYRVAGGEQGKFTVTREAITGKRIVGESQLLEVFASRVQHAARNGE